MNPLASKALSILLWGFGLIPATLIAMWMGLAEFSWPGAVKAFAILAALVATFELLRAGVEAMLACRSRQ